MLTCIQISAEIRIYGGRKGWGRVTQRLERKEKLEGGLPLWLESANIKRTISTVLATCCVLESGIDGNGAVKRRACNVMSCP